MKGIIATRNTGNSSDVSVFSVVSVVPLSFSVTSLFLLPLEQPIKDTASINTNAVFKNFFIITSIPVL
jgi:hypothetical protein